MKRLFSILAIIIIMFLGGLVSLPSASAIGCTEELQGCPDGTSVARNPARNCAFDPCSNERRQCTAEARVCPDGTSVGRDPYNDCKMRPCPSEKNNGCVQCRQTYERCIAQAQLIAMAPGPNRDRAIQSITADCKLNYDDCFASCQKTEPPTCEAGCYALGLGKCVPVSTRLAMSEATMKESLSPMYCAVDGEFRLQKADGSDAQNSYECLSGFQSDGKCISVSENLNILQRILKWFSKIFGGN